MGVTLTEFDNTYDRYLTDGEGEERISIAEILHGAL